MLIVPKGVEHKPIAEEETWIMLFEPIATKHTGDVRHALTVDEYEKIQKKQLASKSSPD